MGWTDNTTLHGNIMNAILPLVHTACQVLRVQTADGKANVGFLQMQQQACWAHGTILKTSQMAQKSHADCVFNQQFNRTLQAMRCGLH